MGDQSLRRIAEAVGTSHRMLLYHFGSKDGLLLAVAQEVERRTRSQVEMLSHDATASTDDHIRQVWAYVADPELAGFERLFFALYGRALQGDEALRPLLEGDVAGWLDANVALASAGGVDAPAPTVRLHAAPGAGRRARAAARPAGHRRAGGGRRRPRAVRPRLRGRVVGGSADGGGGGGAGTSERAS